MKVVLLLSACALTLLTGEGSSLHSNFRTRAISSKARVLPSSTNRQPGQKKSAIITAAPICICYTPPEPNPCPTTITTPTPRPPTTTPTPRPPTTTPKPGPPTTTPKPGPPTTTPKPGPPTTTPKPGPPTTTPKPGPPTTTPKPGPPTTTPKPGPPTTTPMSKNMTGPYMPYDIKWKVVDTKSGNRYSHSESSGGDDVKGEYRVLLPDGRTQVVTFWADPRTGYIAKVQYQ